MTQYQEKNNYLGIKSWSEEDRPREKLKQKGHQALTNAELIAILIGSGTRRTSALDVSKNLLNQAGNNLHALGQFTLHKLTQVAGIGEAKAISIAAALELGRRRKNSNGHYKPKMDSSNEVYDYIYPYFADLNHEQFHLILLDRGNKVIGEENISKGGVAGTVVDPKLVFKYALDRLASSIILCHNHPSGNKQPSNKDRELTSKLRSAGELLEIKVLDHLIFANDGYFSFADENLL